ncbi:hypothetical protein [Deinococcus sp. Leaf326]|uniref:phage adaptor protein n=1 Tax=Deinococcus sp. Leaf326 TaxID=1736338 RepID=UPI0006F220DB|nr:hypothetical protein [Deinococcus sp. Leaf326]KQR22866.1 hypothetical protein ASF71_06785 [Deinococcus sp. Leaf326]
MNRAELRILTRRLLAEAGSGAYTDDTFNNQISRSARSLAGQLGLIQRDVTVITDADGRLAVPDLVNVSGRIRVGGRYLDYPVINYGQMYDIDQRGAAASGAPRGLIVDEGVLGAGIVGVWPSPGAGVEVGFLAFVDGGDLTTDASVPWGNRYETHHDLIAYHAAHSLGAQGGSRNAGDPTWWQRYQLRLEELRDRGSAGVLTTSTRMGSALGRRTRWN